MNDLTGAFLIAQEKKEDLRITRQSLANAGYPIQEIEQALLEAKQISNESVRSEQETIPLKKPMSKIKRIFLWSLLVIILIFISGTTFFFWQDIISLIKNIGGN